MSSSLGELPKFERRGLVIDPTALMRPPLSYPHDDAIFSSMIDAKAYFAQAIGKFYLYFGPHDGPGGVFLAYADALEGPWTVCDADESDADLDPVIGRHWEGHYSVSHVASPHALWIPEEQKMFLWFHGENNVTRYASTTDGIHFQYEGVAVTADDFNDNVEASYARVFREAIPSKNAKYVLLLMGNQSGTRPIFLAWSPDARRWTTQRDPMLVPHGASEHSPQISSPHLLRWEGRKYVVYHQNSLGADPPPGVIWATPVTDDFVQAGKPRALFEPLPVEDANHVWAPSFIADGDALYMFYDSGPRLNCKIRCASTPLPSSSAETKQ
ncbi:MAG: hypothetical protein DCC67_05025 [Planctomycetota bacterium]|nr:MAG: hypothetical protein DCC67_05025 [Planctomycetota bacterium]